MGQHINPLLFEGEHLVRQIERDNELWFIAPDVCRVLGVKNVSDAVDRLDDDEKGIVTIETPGGDQAVNAVSEAGVYRLVFTSRKPVAERFKRWLAHDVIPAIRKTGSFTQAGGGSDGGAGDVSPFPAWPMDELRTKSRVVDMYRTTFGARTAQWIAPQLGFPTPPMDLVDHGRQFVMTLVPQQQEEGA